MASALFGVAGSFLGAIAGPGLGSTGVEIIVSSAKWGAVTYGMGVVKDVVGDIRDVTNEIIAGAALTVMSTMVFGGSVYLSDKCWELLRKECEFEQSLPCDLRKWSVLIVGTSAALCGCAVLCKTIQRIFAQAEPERKPDWPGIMLQVVGTAAFAAGATVAVVNPVGLSIAAGATVMAGGVGAFAVGGQRQ